MPIDPNVKRLIWIVIGAGVVALLAALASVFDSGVTP